MTTAPIVVEVPGSRSDAINIMVRNGLTGLPVIRASDGKLMGVVSRRDVFRNFEEDQLSLIPIILGDMERDPDCAFLRRTPGYQELVKKYRPETP